MTTADDGPRTPAAQFMADADMFADLSTELTQPEPAAQAIFTGQLVRNADVRTQPSRDGLHAVPVVCLELKSLDKKDHRSCYAQIPFKDSERQQAERRAHQLKKGHIVTVAASALEVRMNFPQAQIINSYAPS